MTQRILSILLCLTIIISMAGCGKTNDDKTTNNSKPVINTTPSETEKTPDVEGNENEDATKNEFFKYLSLRIDDANEDYLIEAKNDNGVISGSVGREGSGDIVDMLMSKTDWGNKYSSSLHLVNNVPNNSTIHLVPKVKLEPVESDFDIDWLNVREFDLYFGDVYLTAGSNCFDEIVFDHSDDMMIRGHVGDFMFKQSPTKSMISDGYYPGGYYIVRFYATTTEKSDVSFHFDKDAQCFTIQSDAEISMLTVRVVNDDNEEVDTVERDMKGKNIQFTIKDNYKADIKVIENE